MSKVENYNLIEELARGSSGEIYKARHLNGNICAIKKIKINQFRSDLVYINNEIKILSEICDQNVVKFIKAMKTANHIYLVMEFCEGGDLNSYLQYHNNIPYHIVRIWLKKLIKTLIKLQGKHIVHRDIKPANILLTDINLEIAEIKLADFGFAKKLKNCMADSQVGTPLYMAPEILLSNNYSFKADVWSLGVLTYELLYGFTPFRCLTIEDLKNLQKNGINFPENPNVPEDAISFINSILVYDHKLRPGYEQLLEMKFLKKIFLKLSSINLENIFRDNESNQILLSSSRNIGNNLSEKQIQEIILDLDRKREKLDGILSIKILYAECNYLIAYGIKAFLYAILSEMYFEIEALLGIYENQEKLTNELILITIKINDSYLKFYLKFDEEEKKIQNSIGNDINIVLENFIYECNSLRENIKTDDIERSLLIALIGKQLFPHILFFQEFYNELVDFSLIESRIYI